MNKNIKDAKGIIATLKGLFSNDAPAPAPATTEPQEGAFTGVTAAYNVQGGAPVYVDISDDNIPGIEQGDNVYADAAGVTQYPDGTYTIDGTQFSFTVVAGTVTLIADATGAGPGLPVPAQAAPQAAPTAQAAPQTAPIPAPVPQAAPQAAPVFPPRFAIALPSDFAAFKASFNSDSKESVKLNTEEAYTDMLAVIGKFATGTIDERISAVETMVKALMQYAYGYEIQRIDQQTAINTYKSTVETLQAETQKQAGQLGQYREAGTKLITLFEEFLEIPSAEPKATNEKEKTRIEKEQKKEQNIDRIAATLKELHKK